MNRERLGLSLFEAVLHGNRSKVTLYSEVKDCFEYFEKHRPNAKHDEIISVIHGSKIELRRVLEGKGFAVEINGAKKVLGKDQISKQEQIDMVRKIRSITFPYSDYVKRKHR